MVQFEQFLFSFIFISIVGTTSSEFCYYEGCRDSWNTNRIIPHTMCQYSSRTFGAECNNGVYFPYLTDEEANEILILHNRLRAKVARGKEKRGRNGRQPRGIIQPLKWDRELEIIAQRWANQCIFGHDECRDIGEIRVGQNLGFFTAENFLIRNFTEIVMSWYDEVNMFDSELVTQFNGRRASGCLHYTQLVWGTTTHVGCAGVKYKNYRGDYVYHLVCDYKPAGNMNFEPIYKTQRRKKSPTRSKTTSLKKNDSKFNNRQNEFDKRSKTAFTRKPEGDNSKNDGQLKAEIVVWTNDKGVNNNIGNKNTMMQTNIPNCPPGRLCLNNKLSYKWKPLEINQNRIRKSHRSHSWNFKSQNVATSWTS